MELYICVWMGVKQFFREWERTSAREMLGGGAMLCEGNNAMGWYERARALLCGIEDRKELQDDRVGEKCC